MTVYLAKRRIRSATSEAGRWPNLILGMQSRLIPQPVAAPAQPIATASTGPLSGGVASELQALADLHERGLLNDAEFSSAKSRVLNLASISAPSASAAEDDQVACRR
jgi:hypothetical protein